MTSHQAAWALFLYSPYVGLMLHHHFPCPGGWPLVSPLVGGCSQFPGEGGGLLLLWVTGEPSRWVILRPSWHDSPPPVSWLQPILDHGMGSTPPDRSSTRGWTALPSTSLSTVSTATSLGPPWTTWCSTPTPPHPGGECSFLVPSLGLLIPWSFRETLCLPESGHFRRVTNPVVHGCKSTHLWTILFLIFLFAKVIHCGGFLLSAGPG